MAPRQELIDYVKTELARGATPREVRVTLITNDWPAEEVDEALKMLAPSAPPPTPLRNVLTQESAATHTPSAAALRGPLELIGDAFRIYKEKFWRLFGIALIGQAVALAVSLLMGYFMSTMLNLSFADLLNPNTFRDPNKILELSTAFTQHTTSFGVLVALNVFINFFLQILVLLAIVFGITDRLPGAGIGRAFVSAWKNYLRYLWVTVLKSLMYFGSIGLASVILGILFVALKPSTPTPSGEVVTTFLPDNIALPLSIALMAVFLAFIVLAIKFLVSTALSDFMFVLRGERGVQALYMSSAYVRGLWWRIFGRALLFGLVVLLIIIAVGLAVGSATAFVPQSIQPFVTGNFGVLPLLFDALYLPLLFAFLFALYESLHAFRGDLQPQPKSAQKFGYVSSAIIGGLMVLALIVGLVWGAVYFQGIIEKIIPIPETPLASSGPLIPSAVALAKLNPQPYENLQQGYRVRTPIGWTTKTLGPDNDLVILTEPSTVNETSSLKIQIGLLGTVMSDFSGASVSQNLELMRAGQKMTIAGGESVQEKRVSVNGVDAYIMLFQRDALHSLQFFITTKNDIDYTILTQAPTSRFEEFRPLFEAVFSTFEPLTPQKSFEQPPTE